jgi:hypothetical protein
MARARKSASSSSSPRTVSRTPRGTARRTAGVVRSTPRDLTAGVIVVLSGGGIDAMNPVEVRRRMDEYIDAVNSDPFVQANSGGRGLTFRLLPGQRTNHLHQAKWRQICDALRLLAATPLILIGHSNGGAAAIDLARCLQSQGKSVDLVFSCDSVLTLDDIGDINQVPANVALNLNSYVIPTPAWLLAPFPIGRKNRRQVDNSLDGVLNIGLKYNLPGALAHRNAFYELAGGDEKRGGGFRLPNLLLQSTLAVLRGDTSYDISHAAEASLQELATRSRLEIALETTNFKKTLRP